MPTKRTIICFSTVYKKQSPHSPSESPEGEGGVRITKKIINYECIKKLRFWARFT